MSANPSEPTEQEANIPLDDIIKKLAETVEKLTDVIEKAQKATQKNTSANKDWHKFQAIMKIELEKEHGRQVRLNKEYARSSQSLEMFTGLLSRGVGVGLVFKTLTRSIGGVSKELDKYKAEHAELMRMEQEFAKKGIKIADLGKAGNEQYQEQFRRQQEAVDTAKEGAKGKGGKLAEGISSMKAFADKHKTGILIGAGSVGILLTVLKKAFDVSPMFQAIKKLLHFGIMLVLRPIGDFFGFIMRPIMVMMLRKFIIPWYKDVYPAMKKYGTYIGEKLVPVLESILAFLTKPEGAAVAVGGAVGIGAAVVAANIIMARKILAALGGGTTKAASGAANAVANLQKATTSLRTKVIQLFKHPKMVISQVTSNITAKLKNVTTSVRSAITGVRTALTTTASKITNLFTKGLNNATKGITTKIGQILPNITKGLSNLSTKLGTKIGQIMPKITGGFANLANSLGGLTSKMGGIGKTVTNLFTGKNLGKIGGKGGIIGLIAMLTEGTAASPETLGGLIEQDDPNRLDKQFPWLFGNKLSEDEEGNFKTQSGYGQWLADITNNPKAQEGIVNLAYSGGTGQGGYKEAHGGKGNKTVIINVDHIDSNMDLQHVGDYMSERLQEDNKKSAET